VRWRTESVWERCPSQIDVQLSDTEDVARRKAIFNMKHGASHTKLVPFTPQPQVRWEIEAIMVMRYDDLMETRWPGVVL
jgi:hypothetical protein